MELRDFEFDLNSSSLLIPVLFVALGIACFVGLIFVVVAGGLFAHTLRWELGSQVVVGRVVATEKFTPRNMHSSRVHSGGTQLRNSHAQNMASNHSPSQQIKATVRYELEDVEHTTITRHSLGSAVHVGDQIRLIYLPGYPDKAKQIRPATANYIASLIGLVIGCLILLFAKRILKKFSDSREKPSITTSPM